MEEKELTLLEIVTFGHPVLLKKSRGDQEY